jgi:hypothetical protein
MIRLSMLAGPALLLVATMGMVDDAAGATVVSNTPFTRYASNSCTFGQTCKVAFFTVPAKHIYDIRFVSCFANITSLNAHVQDWELSIMKDQLTVLGNVYLRPTLMGHGTSTTTFQATENAYVRANPGNIVSVSISRDDSGGNIYGINCTIGGDHLVLQ